MSAHVSTHEAYLELFRKIATARDLSEISACTVKHNDGHESLMFKATKSLLVPSGRRRMNSTTIQILIDLRYVPERKCFVVDAFWTTTGGNLQVQSAAEFLLHHGKRLGSRKRGEDGLGPWTIEKPADFSALLEAYDKKARLINHEPLFTPSP